MKILHILPGDNFTEGMTYQDNFLARFNKEDGHDVMILSSCRTWTATEVIYTMPEDRILEDGVRLKRVKYKKIIHHKISEKLRVLDDASRIIDEYSPDIIRILNPHNLTVSIVAKYKKKNPEVKVYIDSHQEYFNSAKGWLSYWIFHKCIIRRMLQKNLGYIDKIFYCQEGVKLFLKKMYSISDEKLEHFPMGGIIFDEETKSNIQHKLRGELAIGNESIVFIHSGKMYPSKKTRDILEAFNSTSNSKFRLFLVGSIPVEMEKQLFPLIERDERVKYVGWKSGKELMEYLLIGDVYLQPGSASATVIQALCCGNALVVAPDIIGYDMLMEDSGWYASDREGLQGVFEEISNNPQIIQTYKNNAMRLAKEKFDYLKLAKRLYGAVLE